MGLLRQDHTLDSRNFVEGFECFLQCIESTVDDFNLHWLDSTVSQQTFQLRIQLPRQRVVLRPHRGRPSHVDIDAFALRLGDGNRDDLQERLVTLAILFGLLEYLESQPDRLVGGNRVEDDGKRGSQGRDSFDYLGVGKGAVDNMGGTKRFQEALVLKRRGGDNGEETGEPSQLKSVMTCRTRTAQDDDRLSSVLATPTWGHRGDETTSMWRLGIQGVIACEQSYGNRGTFFQGYIWRQLCDNSGVCETVLLKRRYIQFLPGGSEGNPIADLESLDLVADRHNDAGSFGTGNSRQVGPHWNVHTANARIHRIESRGFDTNKDFFRARGGYAPILDGRGLFLQTSV